MVGDDLELLAIYEQVEAFHCPVNQQSFTIDLWIPRLSGSKRTTGIVQRCHFFGRFIFLGQNCA